MYWGRKTSDFDDGYEGAPEQSPLIQPQSEAFAGDIRLFSFKHRKEFTSITVQGNLNLLPYRVLQT
jgi:hypothetical protein